MVEPQTDTLPELFVLAGYLTRQQLAAQLKRSVRTLDRWAELRIGPPRVAIGHMILYRLTSVQDWLAAQEQPPRRRRHGK